MGLTTTECCECMRDWVLYSVSARPKFLGVIDDPLFENLGVIGKFRGSELFCVIITFYLSVHASILKVFEECPLSLDNGHLEIRCMFYYR